MSGLLAVRRVGVSGVPRASVLAWVPSAAAAPQTRQPVAAAPDVGRQQRKRRTMKEILLLMNWGEKYEESSGVF